MHVYTVLYILSPFCNYYCLCFQVLQLFQITQLHHGLMMVGPSGSGKSAAWRVLLKALERIEGVEGVSHVIDPKVIDMLHLPTYYGLNNPSVCNQLVFLIFVGFQQTCRIYRQFWA